MLDHNTMMSAAEQRVRDTVFKTKEYELLNVLEFDSNRKRMSIIVKDLATGELTLYCKGADSAMFEKSVCNSANSYDTNLKAFSENGWRTLVLAYKRVNQNDYESYRALIDEANGDILNREEKISSAYDKIESGLTVLGVTSVEDRLQENVENTLYSLRMAGIKIWVLTGDKLETAINISESCKHFSSDMFKFVLKGLKNPNDVRSNLTLIRQE
jgi:phospholipid-translocating ATPase